MEKLRRGSMDTRKSSANSPTVGWKSAAKKGDEENAAPVKKSDRFGRPRDEEGARRNLKVVAETPSAKKDYRRSPTTLSVADVSRIMHQPPRNMFPSFVSRVLALGRRLLRPLT